jgi:hypothetical protein
MVGGREVGQQGNIFPELTCLFFCLENINYSQEFSSSREDGETFILG